MGSVGGNGSASKNHDLAHPSPLQGNGQSQLPVSTNCADEQRARVQLGMCNMRVTAGAGVRVLQAATPPSRKTKVISLTYH